MRCSVSYFIELNEGQAGVNRLVMQQYEYVVVLRTVAALCTRSVLAFHNMVIRSCNYHIIFSKRTLGSLEVSLGQKEKSE